MDNPSIFKIANDFFFVDCHCLCSRYPFMTTRNTQFHKRMWSGRTELWSQFILWALHLAFICDLRILIKLDRDCTSLVILQIVLIHSTCLNRLFCTGKVYNLYTHIVWSISHNVNPHTDRLYGISELFCPLSPPIDFYSNNRSDSIWLRQMSMADEMTGKMCW